MTLSASVWLSATEAEVTTWGASWAERALTSSYADRARELGVTDGTLQRISDGWREWSRSPDAWLLMPHGELLARP